MTLLIISVGSDRAVIFKGESVCTYDPQCDDPGCLEILEQVAVSLSSIHNISIERKSVESPSGDWNWHDLILQYVEQKESNEGVVSVLLQHFDEEGNKVDSSTMELSKSNISDIIDHAAQLAIVTREIASKKSGIEAFDHVYAELESALVVAGVIAEDQNPMPTLGLLG